MNINYVAAGLVAAFLFAGAVHNGKQTGNTVQAQTTPPEPSCRISEDDTKKWGHFVYLLKKEKVIDRVETATITKVFVLPKYHRLTFEEKKKFTGVIHAFTFGCKKDTLFLYDARTNAKIGTYAEWGLVHASK